MRFHVVAAVSFAAATAAAQAATLEPSTPVRVDMRDRSTVRGILTSRTTDSAFVWSTERGGNQGIAWSSIERVRVPMGRSHALGARKGLRLGTLIGAAFGAGIVVAGVVMEPGEYTMTQIAIGALFWSGLGAMEGALFGVIIGSIAGAQRWETAYPQGRTP